MREEISDFTSRTKSLKHLHLIRTKPARKHSNMSEVKPFDPSVPKEEVDRLFQKLQDSRIPKEIVPGAKDDYGFQPPHHKLDDFLRPD